MIERVMRMNPYTGFQLVLLVDLHQIITFLIEFTIIAIVLYKLNRWSADPPKTYALLSIAAVLVFAANIPSFLIFLTLQFNYNLFFIVIPLSIVIEYIFLLVMLIILKIIPDNRKLIGAGILFLSVLIGNLLSYGAFWALTFSL